MAVVQSRGKKCYLMVLNLPASFQSNLQDEDSRKGWRVLQLAYICSHMQNLWVMSSFCFSLKPQNPNAFRKLYTEIRWAFSQYQLTQKDSERCHILTLIRDLSHTLQVSCITKKLISLSTEPTIITPRAVWSVSAQVWTQPAALVRWKSWNSLRPELW